MMRSSPLFSPETIAVAKLIERYAPAVYRFGAKMCRDPEDAKDVMQDTLLAAARGLREFPGGATFHLAVHDRAQLVHQEAPATCWRAERDGPARRGRLSNDPGDGPTAGQGGGEPRARRGSGAAIHELEPMYREVLVLRDVEGLAAPEVATVLGIGVDSVKSRLHRARISVRDRIAPLLARNVEPAASSGCPDVVPIVSQYIEREIGRDCPLKSFATSPMAISSTTGSGAIMRREGASFGGAIPSSDMTMVTESSKNEF